MNATPILLPVADPMPCDVCDAIIPDGHAVVLALGTTILARMHMTCAAEGALWAAKQARLGRSFDGVTPLANPVAGRKQPPPPGSQG